MTEISFYHLSKTEFRKALPSLLEKVLESGKNAVLLAANEDKAKEIDSFLWTFSTKRFIPHGTSADKYKEDQPIYITTAEENPNGSEILIVVDGQNPGFIRDFARVLDIFDGNNPQEVEAARKRWQEYKDKNFKLAYWKQDDSGKWQSEK